MKVMVGYKNKSKILAYVYMNLCRFKLQPKMQSLTSWLLKAWGFSRLNWNPGILASHIRKSAPGPDAYFSTVNTPSVWSYLRKSSLTCPLPVVKFYMCSPNVILVLPQSNAEMVLLRRWLVMDAAPRYENQVWTWGGNDGDDLPNWSTWRPWESA